jgi:predicted AlkP superfamily phosphohydrolase/phosphomutase
MAVVVVGFDGATFDIIDPMIEQGKLKNFQELKEGGTSSNLTSTILPLSSTAWTTFMTGVNPGKHGIYDFAKREKGSYMHVPVNSADRGAQSLWSLASEAGKRCCVVNVPLTYPPEPINGVMVSGFPYPEDRGDYCYPAGFLKELESNLPSIHFHKPSPHFLKQGDEEKLVGELFETIENQIAALRYLIRKERWDLVVTVFDGLDVASHFMWRHIDPNNPRYNPAKAKELGPKFYSVYEEMDRALGEIRKELSPDDNLIVLSDHGFGPLYHAVYMNNWLMQKGYLKLKDSWGTRFRKLTFSLGVTTGTIFGAAKRLRLVGRKTYAYSRNSASLALAHRVSLSLADIDWEKTRVFSSGNYGQFFINCKGREPLGCVPEEDRSTLVDELVAGLKDFRDPTTGKVIFDLIYKREEIYSGRFEGLAPDLVFLDGSMNYMAHRVFEFGSRKMIAPDPIYSGSHHMQGIFVAHGPDIARGQRLDGLQILDLAPTVLHMMGVPVPSLMDGRVIVEAYSSDGRLATAPQLRTARPSKWEIGRAIGRMVSDSRQKGS